jgi:hypothetical protein
MITTRGERHDQQHATQIGGGPRDVLLIILRVAPQGVMTTFSARFAAALPNTS